ncbi:MAG: alpha/beta hydrolase [Candidatus Pelagadaptatus aseana]|uniref:alpha/beta hydrolase fold domain-containing protein n=1 Tax=Candidatus Pelagadaptatus aseana TaxID=3120508 RepID=UPI0039B26849
MTSIKSKILSLIIRLLIKGKLTKELTTGRINRTRDVPAPPAKLKNKFAVSAKTINGHQVFTLSPNNKPAQKVILYLHGGAYVHNFTKQHWGFIEDLLDTLDCSVIAPDYPLAPENTYQETSTFLEKLYLEIIEQTAPENLIIMGDSAGGGMALALVQTIKQMGLPQPSQLFLLSPWLDITMTNPELAEIEKRDPFLDINGLLLAGKAYAGNESPTHYQLSPIYGELEGLGQISIFSGTHDILYADAKQLKAICDTQGIGIKYHEFDKMIHCWMLLRLPESKRVINQISREISA